MPEAAATAARLAAARAGEARERVAQVAARVEALRDPGASQPAPAGGGPHVAIERAELARAHAREALERAALAHDRAADLHEARGEPTSADYHRAAAAAARQRLA
jgi:hypothetical protein